jgi:hypothetical protein
MNHDPQHPGANSDGLDATREAMRRDLNRANTAVGLILVVVLTLAIAAVIAGMRAARSYERAEKAEAASRDRLWNSYVAQARAMRLTPQAGRRGAVLNVISNATAIRRNAGLRSEAIATLALADIETDSPLQLDPARGRSGGDGYGTGALRVRKFHRRGFCMQPEGRNRFADLAGARTWPGTRQAVRSVAFSPDGHKLATRFAGGAMVIWDLTTQKQLLTSGSGSHESYHRRHVVLAGCEQNQFRRRRRAGPDHRF